MKVLVVGANGKVGTLLSGKLWSCSDFSPIALIRDKKQQTKFTALGVPSIIGDLEIGISAFLVGINAVVFTAGSGAKTGPDKTIDVDQNGAIRLIEDCVQNGVKRFIMISAIGADPSSKSIRIQHYLKAKGVADVFLRNSNLFPRLKPPKSFLPAPPPRLKLFEFKAELIFFYLTCYFFSSFFSLIISSRDLFNKDV